MKKIGIILLILVFGGCIKKQDPHILKELVINKYENSNHIARMCNVNHQFVLCKSNVRYRHADRNALESTAIELRKEFLFIKSVMDWTFEVKIRDGKINFRGDCDGYVLAFLQVFYNKFNYLPINLYPVIGMYGNNDNAYAHAWLLAEVDNSFMFIDHEQSFLIKKIDLWQPITAKNILESILKVKYIPIGIYFPKENAWHWKKDKIQF